MHGPPHIFDPLLQASSFPPRTYLARSLPSLFLFSLLPCVSSCCSPLSAVCRLALPCLPPLPVAPRANQAASNTSSTVHAALLRLLLSPSTVLQVCNNASTPTPCTCFVTDRSVTPRRVNDETRSHPIRPTCLSLLRIVRAPLPDELVSFMTYRKYGGGSRADGS